MYSSFNIHARIAKLGDFSQRFIAHRMVCFFQKSCHRRGSRTVFRGACSAVLEKKLCMVDHLWRVCFLSKLLAKTDFGIELNALSDGYLEISKF